MNTIDDIVSVPSNHSDQSFELPLCEALKPFSYPYYGGGELEDIKTTINGIEECIGRLLASKVVDMEITLEEAGNIAGLPNGLYKLEES
tara:strand:- start:311 stop:577 length:267 start_codon:yes stop_codon:yes gene_type:complete